MIALDTNVVVSVIRGKSEPVRRRLEQEVRARTPIALSAIALFELRYGIARSSQRIRSEAGLDAFLTLELEIWPLDEADTRQAGELRAGLESLGMPIGPYDLLIAAQALRRGAVLVTANRRELERIPGLNLVDWTS